VLVRIDRLIYGRDLPQHISRLLAHHDRPPFSGRPSLTGHCGHGWTCRRLTRGNRLSFDPPRFAPCPQARTPVENRFAHVGVAVVNPFFTPIFDPKRDVAITLIAVILVIAVIANDVNENR
jgi:hypothetical protein